MREDYKESGVNDCHFVKNHSKSEQKLPGYHGMNNGHYQASEYRAKWSAIQMVI